MVGQQPWCGFQVSHCLMVIWEPSIAGEGSYSPIGSTPTGVLSDVPVKNRELSVD